MYILILISSLSLTFVSEKKVLPNYNLAHSGKIAYLGGKEFRANLATGKTIRGERVWAHSHNFNIVLGSEDFGKRNCCGKGLSMWGCQETDVKWDVSRLVFHAEFFRKKLVKTSWELRRSGEWRRITQLSLFLSYSIGSSKFVGKHIFYVLHWPLPGFSSVLPEYFPHFWKILDVSYIWYLQQV